MNKKFIYMKDNLTIDKDVISKNEIGIVESESKDTLKIKVVNLDKIIEINKELISEFNPEETGDYHSSKICNRCHKLLPIEEFENNYYLKNDQIRKRPTCKECRKPIDGIGISTKDKKQMLKIKPNKEVWECPICKKKTIPGITSKVVLDHNHETGQPRAWICDSCNIGLGRFKDDISVMENAINYLKQFK